jgi:hypothetical protein
MLAAWSMITSGKFKTKLLKTQFITNVLFIVDKNFILLDADICMKYDRLSETAPGAIIHICTGEHLVHFVSKNINQ